MRRVLVSLFAAFVGVFVVAVVAQPAHAYTAYVINYCDSEQTKPIPLNIAKSINGRGGTTKLTACMQRYYGDINSLYIPKGYKAKINYHSRDGKRFTINSWASGGRWYNVQRTGAFATTRTFDVYLVKK